MVPHQILACRFGLNTFSGKSFEFIFRFSKFHADQTLSTAEISFLNPCRVITQEQQNPFEELDNLYSVIFQRLKGDLLAPALRVLGFLLVPGLTLPRHPRPYEANSPAYIEDFLRLNEGDVRRYLFDLESLLFLDKHNQHIQLFYTSLSDYLFNASRSGMFWINPGVVYADIFEHTMLHLPTWPDVGEYHQICV